MNLNDCFLSAATRIEREVLSRQVTWFHVKKRIKLPESIHKECPLCLIEEMMRMINSYPI